MQVVCTKCSKATARDDAGEGQDFTCAECGHLFIISTENLFSDEDMKRISDAISSDDEVEKEEPPVQSPSLPDDMPEMLGTYILDRELAFGAVGKVFLAHHKSLKIPVAVKVLSREITENLVTSQRFIREAQAAAQMNHINIVRILDCGLEEGGPKGDILYYSMEYVQGGSTGAEHRKGKIYSESETLAIGQSVCRALAEAVKHSIVHRDIKPDNIMVASEGLYKLADLGLAKSTAHDEQNTRSDLTGYQIGMGTPHYMAPEQAIDAKNVDIRADLYSLGVTLFQLSTGKLPYPGSDVGAVLRQHAVKAIPNIKDFNSNLSDGFAAMIKKCMAKMPEDRFQTPHELELHLNLLRAPLMDSPIHQDTVTDISPAYGSMKEMDAGGEIKKVQTTYKIIIAALLLIVVILILMLTGK